MSHDCDCPTCEANATLRGRKSQPVSNSDLTQQIKTCVYTTASLFLDADETDQQTLAAIRTHLETAYHLAKSVRDKNNAFQKR